MNDQRLRLDLADLAEEVTPVDLRDRALRTSRRIGIQRAVATSAAAVVMLAAATGTAFAILPDRGADPLPATTPSVTPTPPPTPDASPSPSTATKPADAPTPLTADEVRNATIRVGKWNEDFCHAGTYRFKDGTSTYLPRADSPGVFIIVGTPSIVDIDRDGDLDAVALIRCSPFAVSAEQVVALHRTKSGEIATLGQVTVTGAQPGGGALTEVKAAADGAVRVRWKDTQLGGDAAQWRTYRWDGDGFRQSDGPTSFPKVSIDLKITAGTGTLVKEPTGSYQGDLVVTVTNIGEVAIDQAGLHLTLPPSVSLATVRGVVDNRASVHDNGPPKIMLCELPAVPAGKSVTITFRLVFTGSGQPAPASVRVFSDQGDNDDSNNQARYTLTTSEG